MPDGIYFCAAEICQEDEKYERKYANMCCFLIPFVPKKNSEYNAS